MIRTWLRAAGIVVVGLALSGLLGTAVAGAGSAPARLYEKNYRLDVSLHDYQDGVFDATLGEVHATVPAAVADYLSAELGSSSFEVDATNARCFVVDGSDAQRIDCLHVGDLVDDASDGGVDATILAKPVRDSDGDLGFAAKKITVWVDSSGEDVTPPDPPADNPPPKFFTKNLRLDVNLEDVNDLVFDATLNDIPSSVPSSFAEYLYGQLSSWVFEVNAKHARCFLVESGNPKSIDCGDLADALDESPDGGIDARILARPVRDADGELGFAAKKITVWQ
jgi:hypothetical protein